MNYLKDSIYITEATSEDTPILADLQCRLAWETEEYQLDKNTVQQGLQALLEDKRKGVYYKVADAEKIIGCVFTTFEWSEWRNTYVLWIQSLYIIPAYRGKGLFRAMYNFFQKKVKTSKELGGIRLYVDKSNQKAIQVYESVGMSKEHYEMYEWLGE